MTKLAVATVFVVAALSDVVGAAVVAGAFSMLNTVLLTVLHRRQGALREAQREVRDEQREVREVLTAPRRIVYDPAGNPIGTVIDLERAGGWDHWQQGRRQDDPPPAPPPS